MKVSKLLSLITAMAMTVGCFTGIDGVKSQTTAQAADCKYASLWSQ